MTDLNRHIICYTARDISPTQYRFGATWSGQDDISQVIRGSLAEAEAVLALRIERDARPVEPGMVQVLEFTQHRLHSWHVANDASWGSAPMGGRENHDAWVNGPGSEAL